MFNKLILFLLVAIFLTACSEKQETSYESDSENTTNIDDTNVKDENDEENEPEESTETVEAEKDEEPVVETISEPAGTMEDWITLNNQQRSDIINQSLEYEKAQQAADGAKVEILGTVEDFIQVLDARYEEIDNSNDNSERFRMMNSSIAAQVSIMGHQRNLINFVYNQ